MIELMILLVVVITISAIFIHLDLKDIAEDIVNALREPKK